MSIRCLELYCGIGGFAVAAAQLRWTVVGAIDINQIAAEVYRLNFSHEHQVRTIESIHPADLARFEADLWWMSPPCQPFTRRGVQRDVTDNRVDSFIRVLKLIRELRPERLAMENVPNFKTSQAADELRDVLASSGYRWRELELCPSEFGIPNRRRRFYLVAARHREPARFMVDFAPRNLADFVRQDCGEELFVDGTVEEYADAMHCVDPCEPHAMTSCFTSAYGKSPIRSGSYLRVGERLRRFSPREILGLLGFPDTFQLTSGLSTRRAWKLVGNSLSIPVVVHVLRSIGAELRPH